MQIFTLLLKFIYPFLIFVQFYHQASTVCFAYGFAFSNSHTRTHIQNLETKQRQALQIETILQQYPCIVQIQRPPYIHQLRRELLLTSESWPERYGHSQNNNETDVDHLKVHAVKNTIFKLILKKLDPQLYIHFDPFLKAENAFLFVRHEYFVPYLIQALHEHLSQHRYKLQTTIKCGLILERFFECDALIRSYWHLPSKQQSAIQWTQALTLEPKRLVRTLQNPIRALIDRLQQLHISKN